MRDYCSVGRSKKFAGYLSNGESGYMFTAILKTIF